MAPDLVLRDIHAPPPPPWWPPAPGWWMLVALLLLAAAAVLWWRWRRRLERRRLERLFDDALAACDGPAQRIAAMSGLLRRAARQRDPEADRLQGDDWLRFLDAGKAQGPFHDGIGRALLAGGFRREVDDVDIDALQVLVRRRFLDWTAPR
jgi:hypothetical protein